MSIDFPDPLLVMALPMESQGVFERAGLPVLYTGIGKVNATYALTRRLGEYLHSAVPLPQVINFGTVGSRRRSKKHRRVWSSHRPSHSCGADCAAAATRS
jgi:hypothetical protein